MGGIIQITVSENAAAVLRQVKTFPAEMAQGIARALDLQNELTVGHIQAKKLSRRGPTTLGVITNRLRSSVRPATAEVTGDTIESSIGTNVKYAGVHEYGFDGKVSVAAHTRRRFGDRFSGGSKVVDTIAIFNTKTGSISRQKKGKVKYQTGVSSVRAFTRHMRMPARPFLSTSLTERAANYTQAVSAAILTAWQGNAGGPA